MVIWVILYDIVSDLVVRFSVHPVLYSPLGLSWRHRPIQPIVCFYGDFRVSSELSCADMRCKSMRRTKRSGTRCQLRYMYHTERYPPLLLTGDREVRRAGFRMVLLRLRKEKAIPPGSESGPYKRYRKDHRSRRNGRRSCRRSRHSG